MFVGNLNYQTTPNDLESLFSEAGAIVEVFLPSDRNTGRPRGFAFVEFTDEDSAASAIEKFNGYELQGRALRVNEAEARPSRPRFTPDASEPRREFQKRPKPKGSRRNARGKKRSL